MPELPEVEHTRRNLVAWLAGAHVVAVVASDPRVIRPTKPEAFAKALAGTTVGAIDRKGKWLRIVFEGTAKKAAKAAPRLFVHLGMTGWFEHSSGEPSGNPHPSADGVAMRFERVRFEVKRPRKAKGEIVSYVDPRRWGQLLLADDDIPSWTRLGPDPLDDGIDLEVLAKRLARRKSTSIKETLMDQTVLAGVGNIQAMEALWKAKIDPRSAASAITAPLLRKIAKGLSWTIERTLADLAREDGGEKNPFKIYGRKGEPCPRCKATLERFELGGRTTTMCPKCQIRV